MKNEPIKDSINMINPFFMINVYPDKDKYTLGRFIELTQLLTREENIKLREMEATKENIIIEAEFLNNKTLFIFKFLRYIQNEFITVEDKARVIGFLRPSREYFVLRDSIPFYTYKGRIFLITEMKPKNYQLYMEERSVRIFDTDLHSRDYKFREDYMKFVTNILDNFINGGVATSTF